MEAGSASEPHDPIAGAPEPGEALYRTLVDALTEGVVLQGADGSIQTCNASAERILGLTRDQMAGRTSMDPLWSVVHEDGSPFPGETHPAMVTLRTGEPVRDVVMGVHRPDGTFAWISVSATPLIHPGAHMPHAVIAVFTELGRTREALRRSEERYREFVDSLPDQVFAIDRDLRYTVWNTESERATGISATDALGRTMYEVFPAFAGTDAEAAVLDALATGKPRTLVQEFALKGESLAFSVRISPTADGASCVSRDITDVMRSAAALRESEERYRAIFEEAPIGIALSESETGRYLEINERHAAMVGRSRSEMLEVDWMSITHPDDVAPDQAGMAQLIAGAIPGFQMEKRYLRPDGSVVVVDTRVIRVRPSAMGQRRNLTIVEDITERKAAQVAARASEERFRALFHNAPLTGIVYRLVRDEAGEIVDWQVVDVNEGGAAAIGLPAADLLGRRARDLYGDATMAGYLEISREVSRTGLGRTWEEHFETNGRDYLTAVFMVGEDQYANVSVDVTEQRRAQDRLERAERLEAVGRLASGVAHDFNNLLTAIDGYADLLGGTLLREDPRLDDVQAIRDAASRAAILTRRLLSFGRRHTLQPETLDLRALVAGLAPVLRSLAGDNVDLVIPRGDDPALIHADRSQVEQIVVNLVVNARDAMAGGGQVVIGIDRIEEPADGRSAPEARVPGPHVRLTITDTGAGIADDTLAHIFDPFFTTKAPGQGTGLGLAVVDGAVAQASGFITVESRVGTGTTFTVHLPEATAGSVATPQATPPPLAPMGSETILLVDDDPGVRAVVGRMLRESGYAVVEAASPAIAMAIAESGASTFDLLLTDVVMPGISGFELAQRLLRERSGLPVLFMSAYAADTQPGDGNRPADITLLDKPFTREALTTRVRALLDAHVASALADRTMADGAHT